MSYSDFLSDYSDLPPQPVSNGPRDHEADDGEEEENGYDFPKPRLPLPPARRTLSEMGGSLSSSSSSSSLCAAAAFNRLSLDADAGATARKFNSLLILKSVFFCFVFFLFTMISVLYQ